MTHWHTSSRVTNNSADRSQTARPSRVAKGFFSLSRKRDELPAAGRMTANLAMAYLLGRHRDGGRPPGGGRRAAIILYAPPRPPAFARLPRPRPASAAAPPRRPRGWRPPPRRPRRRIGPLRAAAGAA